MRGGRGGVVESGRHGNRRVRSWRSSGASGGRCYASCLWAERSSPIGHWAHWVPYGPYGLDWDQPGQPGLAIVQCMQCSPGVPVYRRPTLGQRWANARLGAGALEDTTQLSKQSSLLPPTPGIARTVLVLGTAPAPYLSAYCTCLLLASFPFNYKLRVDTRPHWRAVRQPAVSMSACRSSPVWAFGLERRRVPPRPAGQRTRGKRQSRQSRRAPSN